MGSADQRSPIPANRRKRLMFNISTRRIGGIRFIKIGRFCFSFCVTREYIPLTVANSRRYRRYDDYIPLTDS